MQRTTHAMRTVGVDFDVDMEPAPASPPTSRSTDGESSSPTAQPPASKWRKPTYIVRKEEKAELMRELEHLQTKLLALQKTESEASAEAEAARRQTLLQHELETSLMRDAVRLQQLSLVQVQSAVSGYVSVQEAVSHNMPLYLSADLDQRRRALVAFRPRKTHAALAYLSERTRFLDPFRPLNDTSRFLLDGGDYCAMCTEVMPLDGQRVSVRQVYDAMMNYVEDMEMRLTVVLGDITTRDDSDYGVEGIRQSRIVSSLSCGAQLEMNIVNCHEFVERSDEHADGGPFAVLTAQFVERDELFPYSPRDRLRQDINVVVTIRAHTRKRVDSETKKEVNETVVVMKRGCFAKLHRTDIALPPMVQHTLRENIARWGEVMVQSVVEQVNAR